MATWSRPKNTSGGCVCVYRLTEHVRKRVEESSQARLKRAMKCTAPLSCRKCKEYKRCAALYRQMCYEEMNARLRGQRVVFR